MNSFLCPVSSSAGEHYQSDCLHAHTLCKLFRGILRHDLFQTAKPEVECDEPDCQSTSKYTTAGVPYKQQSCWVGLRAVVVVYLSKEGLHISILSLHGDRHIIWPCVVILTLSLVAKRKTKKRK